VFRDLALAIVTSAGHLPRITLETGELTTALALAAAGLDAAFAAHQQESASMTPAWSSFR
jgi:hypothetical protein